MVRNIRYKNTHYSQNFKKCAILSTILNYHISYHLYYITIINDYENMTHCVTRIRPDDRPMIASPTIRGLLKILSIG